MSSSYLTSTDMTMISRLLAEARGTHAATDDLETGRARQLVAAFQRGVDTEAELRGLLVDLVEHTTVIAVPAKLIPQRSVALEVWDNEGGARC